MRPEWLRETAELNTGQGSGVGVAIGVSDRSMPSLHAGVVFRSQDAQPMLLHLAFHTHLRLEPVKESKIKYWWTKLDLLPEQVQNLAALCRDIYTANKSAIGYGVAYHGGYFDEEHKSLILCGEEIGLTCATFVLAVLATAGVDLLEYETWAKAAEDPARAAEDKKWHGQIYNLLERCSTGPRAFVPRTHLARFRRERTCARIRPDDVAASAPMTDQPRGFADVAPLGQTLRAWLVSGDES